MIARVQALQIQLVAVRPFDQRYQQALGLFAQIGFQAAPETGFEQPEAGLHEHQRHQQQGGDEGQAEAALDRLHAAPPKR